MKIKGLSKRGEIYWYRHMVNGKRIQVSLETTDLETAITKAIERRNTGPIKDDERIEALWNRWIDERSEDEDVKQSTQNWARGAMTQFQNHFGDRNIATFSQNDVEAWFKATRARVSNASAASYLRCVKSFFSWSSVSSSFAVETGSSAEAGSSRSRISGSTAMPRATHSRCC